MASRPAKRVRYTEDVPTSSFDRDYLEACIDDLEPISLKSILLSAVERDHEVGHLIHVEYQRLVQAEQARGKRFKPFFLSLVSFNHLGALRLIQPSATLSPLFKSCVESYQCHLQQLERLTSIPYGVQSRSGDQKIHTNY